MLVLKQFRLIPEYLHIYLMKSRKGNYKLSSPFKKMLVTYSLPNEITTGDPIETRNPFIDWVLEIIPWHVQFIE